MSISPPGDIVLDVLRAADPARAEAATRKLQSAADSAGAVSFSELADAAAGVRPTTARSSIRPRALAAQPSAVLRGSAGRTDAASALGALLLQKMIEAMLPKPTAMSFGAGTAGSIWRATLAEKLSQAVAPSVFGALASQAPASPGASERNA